jgi:aryl-alcohol dehydrogenase-like predicted oxidoreductase
MQISALGRSGLHVSELALGAMTFGMPGWGCDEATSAALVNRFLDAGGNLIDTANVYLDSEVILGQALVGRRDEAVVATKVGLPKGTSPNSRGSGRANIRRACEASLRRLQTDRIDLYWIHVDDETTPLDETMSVLDDLVREGKVLYIGASNYQGYRLTESWWLSHTRGLERFVALQSQYSLMVRDLERECVPVCRDKGIGILPWSPLGGGFLSGKYRKGQEPPAGSRLDKWRERLARFDSPRNWRILDALTSVSEALGATPASVALAWLLAKPQVTSVIFGARTVEQVSENLAATEVTLSPAQVTELDEASAFEIGYPYDFIGRVSDGRW